MEDVGTLTNEIYVPDRWLPSVQASLSHKLALQLPGVDMQRIGYLEQQAEKLGEINKEYQESIKLAEQSLNIREKELKILNRLKGTNFCGSY